MTSRWDQELQQDEIEYHLAYAVMTYARGLVHEDQFSSELEMLEHVLSKAHDNVSEVRRNVPDAAKKHGLEELMRAHEKWHYDSWANDPEDKDTNCGGSKEDDSMSSAG